MCVGVSQCMCQCMCVSVRCACRRACQCVSICVRVTVSVCVRGCGVVHVVVCGRPMCICRENVWAATLNNFTDMTSRSHSTNRSRGIVEAQGEYWLVGGSSSLI